MSNIMIVVFDVIRQKKKEEILKYQNFLPYGAHNQAVS